MEPTFCDTQDMKFQEGDVWEFETRADQGQSRLTIVKLDESPRTGTILHVFVDGLAPIFLGDREAPNVISHMPFTTKALDSSVIRRVATITALPDYEEGYEAWRNEFLCGEAGAFTVSVKEAVAMIVDTAKQ